MIQNELKPPIDEALAHYGVKGMKWGQRKSTNYAGASPRTNREARGDAKEFARAKLFYGEGAGTRRKLIKAKVEAKAKKDPTYKKAFDHHLNSQDLGKHAEKARGERRRKDVKAKTGKAARGVNRAVNGPFAAGLTTVAATAAFSLAQNPAQRRKLQKTGEDFLRRTFNN